MKTIIMTIGLIGFATASFASEISIRTEERAHPPYSGTSYHIYEKAGAVICTKARTCNKYDECSTEYRAGTFLQEGDGEDVYKKSRPIVISKKSLIKHKCLTTFKLI